MWTYGEKHNTLAYEIHQLIESPRSSPFGRVRYGPLYLKALSASFIQRYLQALTRYMHIP